MADLSPARAADHHAGADPHPSTPAHPDTRTYPGVVQPRRCGVNALLDWVNTWAVWAGLGLLTYLAVSGVIAWLIGRSFRVREQQAPQECTEEVRDA